MMMTMEGAMYVDRCLLISIEPESVLTLCGRTDWTVGVVQKKHVTCPDCWLILEVEEDVE